MTPYNPAYLITFRRNILPSLMYIKEDTQLLPYNSKFPPYKTASLSSSVFICSKNNTLRSYYAYHVSIHFLTTAIYYCRSHRKINCIQRSSSKSDIRLAGQDMPRLSSISTVFILRDFHWTQTYARLPQDTSSYPVSLTLTFWLRIFFFKF